uniref:Uncharacterized protein n=1 Tax=Strigamia maritima TaxID=126957 RepID=T1IHH7_STRMM
MGALFAQLLVSREWTEYGKVDSMYAAGDEIASYSIRYYKFYYRIIADRMACQIMASLTRSWHDEMYGQKEILSRYGGVKKDNIRCMRAPFLVIGGDKMFSMLHEDNFTYDSSVTIVENTSPFWPHTLDFSFPHECAIPPCSTKSFPGLVTARHRRAESRGSNVSFRDDLRSFRTCGECPSIYPWVNKTNV